MKTDISHLEKFRHTKAGTAMATKEGDRYGVFYIQNARTMFIMIFDDGHGMDGGEDGSGWEHLSLRAKDYSGERVPTWSEMCWAKDLFWDEEECAVQFHPPKSEYVNNHPFVLHLWRQVSREFPRPQSILVGIKT
jgi:hypothetical protein